jgi:hypothetical protein
MVSVVAVRARDPRRRGRVGLERHRAIWSRSGRVSCRERRGRRERRTAAGAVGIRLGGEQIDHAAARRRRGVIVGATSGVGMIDGAGAGAAPSGGLEQEPPRQARRERAAQRVAQGRVVGLTASEPSLVIPDEQALGPPLVAAKDAVSGLGQQRPEGERRR